MSVAMTTAVWQTADAGGSDLLVMVAIADVANDEGVAFISYRDLGQKVRVSERQAKRIVKRLADARQLGIVEQGGMVGSRRFANVYRLTPHGLGGDTLTPGDAQTTPRTGGPGDTPGVAPVSHHTSLEQDSPDGESSEKTKRVFEASEAIQTVFDEWVRLANPSMKTLTAARKRDVAKLLRTTEDVRYAVRAVRGYVLTSKSKDKSIGGLVSTYANTGTLASRIDHFAANDPGDDGNGDFPTIPPGLSPVAEASLRAALKEHAEALRREDEQWAARVRDGLPSAFKFEHGADGRWRIMQVQP